MTICEAVSIGILGCCQPHCAKCGEIREIQDDSWAPKSHKEQEKYRKGKGKM